jgi:hypothetical protein
LLGLSNKSVSLIRDNKFDYQWYKSEDDSKLNGGTVKYESNHDYNYISLRLQKIINNVRFDLNFTPEVISKENYSGDYTGESKTRSGRTIDLNVTKLCYNNDFSLGYNKENENIDSNDSTQVSYNFGYNYFSPNFVYGGTIDYTKSEKISGLIEPYTSLDILNILSFLNKYVITYRYMNYQSDDLGESSDKYRITEQDINWLGVGVVFDI